MNAISGQNYAGFANAQIQTLLLFMNNFSAQVGGNRQGAAPGSNRVALAQVCDYSCDASSPALWGAWGGALGRTGVIAGIGNSGTLTYNVGGFAAGIDRRIAPYLLLGVTLGWPAMDQWLPGKRQQQQPADRPLRQLQ